MAIGRATVVKQCGTVTLTGGVDALFAPVTIPAGQIFAITDVQFSVNMVPALFRIQEGVNNIAGYNCVEEKITPATTPFSYTRHYGVPIVIDASAGAKTFGMTALGTAQTVAYGSIIGEQSDLINHTERRYGHIVGDGIGATFAILPAAYIVPAGQKLSITDLDFSVILVAVPSPNLFEVRINGTPVYYTELMTDNAHKMISLECPIEVLAGQSVQLWVTDLAGGKPINEYIGSFVGQLL